MTVLRTLLTDGTDLRGLTGVNVLRMDLYAPGIRRDDPSSRVIPGQRGQLSAELPLDAFQFAIAVEVTGTSEANKIVNLRALYSAVNGSSGAIGLPALERRLPNVGGTYDSYTARGMFAGLTDMVDTEAGFQTQLNIQLINLDGAWFDGSNWIVP